LLANKNQKEMKKNIVLLSLFATVALISCNQTEKKETQSMTNPLLETFNTPFGVPSFDQIATTDYMPAFEEAMRIHNQEIADIIAEPEAPTFENTLEPMAYSGELL